MKRGARAPENPHAGLSGLALELARVGIPLRRQLELARNGADLREVLENAKREARP